MPCASVLRPNLLGQGVMLVDELFQPLLQNMRIDFCRRYVCMAEQLLHGAQVRAAVEQMAGKGVADNVR